MAISGILLSCALAGTGYYWYQQDQQRRASELERSRIEAETKRQLEQQHLAELENARKLADEAQRARTEAELRLVQLEAEKGNTKRMDEKGLAESRGTQARPSKDALAKQRASQAAEADLMLQKQLESNAAAAKDRAGPAAPSAQVARQELSVVAPVAVPSPEAICNAASNFITRAICETRECIKPEYYNSNYCAALRDRLKK